MIHEDNPEHETMTESHVLLDKEPVRVDSDAVKDDSSTKKPMWNRWNF